MKDKGALVSVVIPTYNVENYIGHCVSSLLRQTYRNIEVIIVSDGSTDRSVEICREMQKTDGRIRIIEKENGGVSSARNMGIRCAAGDYLMLVDGDDWVEQNTIETMLQAIQDNQTDACFSNCYYRNEWNVITAMHCKEEPKVAAHELIKKHLKYQFLASPWLTLVRLTKVKQCMFDESIHTLEDWEYNFRMLNCIDSGTIINEPLYHYREVPGSASKSKLNERKLTCFLIPERVERYIKENDLPYKKSVGYIWIFLLNHMLILLANNEYVPTEAKKLKKIAQKKLVYAWTAENIPLKQRIYTLMCAISPRVFCWVYHLKYLWRK